MTETEQNKLHVGGLSFDSTGEDLKDLFAKFGEVEDGKSCMGFHLQLHELESNTHGHRRDVRGLLKGG